jgi:hypothetical protein
MIQPAPACDMTKSASCMSIARDGLKQYTSTSIPAACTRSGSCEQGELAGASDAPTCTESITASLGRFHLAPPPLDHQRAEAPFTECPLHCLRGLHRQRQCYVRGQRSSRRSSSRAACQSARDLRVQGRDKLVEARCANGNKYPLPLISPNPSILPLPSHVDDDMQYVRQVSETSGFQFQNKGSKENQTNRRPQPGKTDVKV